jgi:dihydroorotate dehydrogenase electron transfer subunit
MKKTIHDLKVISNIKVNYNNFILELEAPEPLGDIFPGQFAEVLINKSKSVFLRRPFSIHDVNYEKNTISLLIQVIGEGTKVLSEINKDDYLNMVYPLGNSFSLQSGVNALLIGGGTGIAPIYFLAKNLVKLGVKSSVLIGSRDIKGLLRADDFKNFADLFFTTEDGSAGERGLVTDHSLLKDTNRKFDIIYACGPEPMMKAIGAYAVKNNIKCEVSLENMMACGVGACFSKGKRHRRI